MMKKLNNKGYLLVEIIVSFVIAMGVAFFLAEITINLKERQQDLDKQIQFNVDKSLMTKEVMDDVNKYKVESVTSVTNGCRIKYKDVGNREIKITKNGSVYTYNYNGYTKKFDSSLTVGNISCSVNNNVATIKVSAKSQYSDKDYGLNLVIPYTG